MKMRSWTKVLGLIAVGGLALWTLGATSNPTSSNANAEGYSFTNVEVVEQDGHTATIEYDYSWSGPGFPGWRKCQWLVYSSTGEALGSKDVEVVGLASEYSEKRHQVEIAGGPAHHAEIACQPGRLDAPQGHYSISNITVERNPAFDGDLRSLLVTFDEHWVGAGIPGPQACTTRIFARSGRPLVEWESNFVDTSGGREGAEMHIIAPGEVIEAPDHATIRCQAITGP